MNGIDSLYVINFILVATAFAVLAVGVFTIFRHSEKFREHPGKRVMLGLALIVSGALIFGFTPRIALFLDSALIGGVSG